MPTTIFREGENSLGPVLISLIMPLIISSAALKSAITPSLSGLITRMFSCVLPCICRALSPMAISFPVFLSMATMEGSSTTSLSLAIIFVFAVPRSIATSCDRNENNPIGPFEIASNILMFKMPYTCKNHGNTIFIAVVDRFLITY